MVVRRQRVAVLLDQAREGDEVRIGAPAAGLLRVDVAHGVPARGRGDGDAVGRALAVRRHDPSARDPDVRHARLPARGYSGRSRWARRRARGYALTMKPGDTLKERYRLDSVLGQGAGGTTYLATRPLRRARASWSRRCPSPASGSGATSTPWNARRASSPPSGHPRVPRSIDSFSVEDEGSQAYVLVREYVPGSSLEQKVSGRVARDRGGHRPHRRRAPRDRRGHPRPAAARDPPRHQPQERHRRGRRRGVPRGLRRGAGAREARERGGHDRHRHARLRARRAVERQRHGALGPVRLRRHDPVPAHALEPRRAPLPRHADRLPPGREGLPGPGLGPGPPARAGRGAAHAGARPRDRGPPERSVSRRRAARRTSPPSARGSRSPATAAPSRSPSRSAATPASASPSPASPPSGSSSWRSGPA